MVVKWNGVKSSSRPLYGGGPQGGLLGIIEYTSQSNSNADFVEADERFKFIDDLSLIEIINLLSIGLTSFNCKVSVPSDVGTDNQYLPPANIKSQTYMDELSDWTKSKQMKLNVKKSNYMIINYTKKYQFNTRLSMEGTFLEQVHQTKLVGLIVSDDLSW